MQRRPEIIAVIGNQPAWKGNGLLVALLENSIERCVELQMAVTSSAIIYDQNLMMCNCTQNVQDFYSAALHFSRFLWALFLALSVHNAVLHSLQAAQSGELAENNGCGALPRISAVIYPRVMVKPGSGFYNMKHSCKARWRRQQYMLNPRQWSEAGNVRYTGAGIDLCCFHTFITNNNILMSLK